jgi:hypothetical protein
MNEAGIHKVLAKLDRANAKGGEERLATALMKFFSWETQY